MLLNKTIVEIKNKVDVELLGGRERKWYEMLKKKN